MTNERPTLQSWILLLLLTIIWGSSFILIKKGLDVFSPVQVASIRIITSALFLLPFAISWLRSVERKHLFIIFISGVIGSLIPAFLFSLAQTRLDSSVTGVINALTPLFVLIVGVIFYRQKIKNIVIFGLLLAFGGTLGLILFGPSDDSYSISYFALWVVLATFLYGINVNIIKYNLSHINPMAITSISLVFIGPFTAIILFFFTDFKAHITFEREFMTAIGYLSLLGVVGTGLALLMFNRLIKKTSPLFSSSVTYLIPLVAISWGIIDGENILFVQYLCMIGVIAGVLLASK